MTYPQPQDWPIDESRIDAIMQNGNDGDHYDELGLCSYLSAHDEVRILKAEVERLTKRLNTEIKLKSSWKSKYQKLKPSRLIEPSKKSMAIDMIHAIDNGDKTKSLAGIARELDINPQTVKSIARAFRQAIKTN
jgi:hypothetical protein